MKRLIRILGLGILINLACRHVYGQETVLPQHYLSLRHDNDYLNLAGHGTDQYYTAGNYLKYSFLSPAHRNILNKIFFSPDYLHPLYRLSV